MAKDMMAQEFSPQEDSYWIRDLCDWSGHKDCWPNAVKDPSVETHTNMHLVPAPAVRLMKRRVLSRPGVNSLMSSLAWWITNVASFQVSTAWLDPKKNEREA